MKDEDKIDLLKKELDLNRVTYEHGLIPDTKLVNNNSFWEELVYCMYPTTHELLIPDYGVMFVEDKKDAENYIIKEHNGIKPNNLRKFVDGKSSFLLYEKEQLLGILQLDSPATSELDLVTTNRTLKGTIIQRHSNINKIFKKDEVFICKSRNWSKKEKFRTYLNKIRVQCPQIDEYQVITILEFCYYFLSDLNIGATLIYYLNDNISGQDNRYDGLEDLSSLDISINDKNNLQTLLSMLSQVDGATVFDEKTNLKFTEIKLSVSSETEQLIKPFKGTRHTSARRFSYEVPNCIIFTVSEDGPVSIFSDGAEIINITPFTGLIAGYERTFGRQMSRLYTCEKCNKNLKITLFIGNDSNEKLEDDCPVCGRSVGEFNCRQIEVWVEKTI